MTDRQLVARFLNRADEISFRHLYRLHAPMLYRVILRTVGRADVAEETLQETWIRAVGGLSRFRWESSLRTWLTGIALRCCHETRRAAPMMVPQSGEIGEVSSSERPTPDLRLDLERAVAALPQGRREVLLLHDVEGFTHSEIAALLSISEGTSKSQLSRARQEIRLRLDTGGDTQSDREVRHDVRE